MSEDGLTELLFVRWAVRSTLAFPACGYLRCFFFHTVFFFPFDFIVRTGQEHANSHVLWLSWLQWLDCFCLCVLFKLLVHRLKLYLMQCDFLEIWRRLWNILREIFLEVQRSSIISLFAKELFHWKQFVILLILHKKLTTINFGSCYVLLLHATCL